MARRAFTSRRVEGFAVRSRTRSQRHGRHQVRRQQSCTDCADGSGLTKAGLEERRRRIQRQGHVHVRPRHRLVSGEPLRRQTGCRSFGQAFQAHAPAEVAHKPAAPAAARRRWRSRKDRPRGDVTCDPPAHCCSATANRCPEARFINQRLEPLRPWVVFPRQPATSRSTIAATNASGILGQCPDAFSLFDGNRRARQFLQSHLIERRRNSSRTRSDEELQFIRCDACLRVDAPAPSGAAPLPPAPGRGSGWRSGTGSIWRLRQAR